MSSSMSLLCVSKVVLDVPKDNEGTSFVKFGSPMTTEFQVVRNTQHLCLCIPLGVVRQNSRKSSLGYMFPVVPVVKCVAPQTFPIEVA